jgi:lipoprotein-anchoring transpeptidase ErfK/SrfK
LASVTIALAASSELVSAPAVAGFDGNSQFDPATSPNPILRSNLPPPPRSEAKPQPKIDATKIEARKIEAKAAQKPEQKDFGPLPKGPLQIVVSIADQHVTLYSNGSRVAQGPVSTGVPGRPTPTGVFSIIQKDRFHHSNLYSNAPMPFMERITWSGVALHEGPLPGYPASHGCIRLSHDFAARLWVVARLGVRVIVARNEVVPTEFAHPHLFDPRPKPADPDPAKPADAGARMSFAQAVGSDAGGAKPADSGLGVPPVAADRLRGSLEPVGPAAAAAPEQVKPAAGAESQDSAPPPAPPKAPALATPKRTGNVAVFISRREKKLFVRQGFEPLFDMPIEIEHPEQPFGTHVFTALGLTEDGAHMRWNVMSIAAGLPRPPVQSKIGASAKAQAVERTVVTYAPQTATQVLDRIQIPQEAIDRIGEILSSGSSLVVSDQGLGEETGEGTDFIVLTR